MSIYDCFVTMSLFIYLSICSLVITFVELEIKLRHNAQKLRVVPSLTGNAHVLFPTSDTTVAVRVYDPMTIAKMEKELSAISNSSSSNNDHREKLRIQTETLFQNNDSTTNDGTNNNNGSENDNDFDKICSFRDSFKHPIVFFILPSSDLMSDQLGRVDSVVNILQRSLSTMASQKEGKKVRMVDSWIHLFIGLFIHGFDRFHFNFKSK